MTVPLAQLTEALPNLSSAVSETPRAFKSDGTQVPASTRDLPRLVSDMYIL